MHLITSFQLILVRFVVGGSCLALGERGVADLEAENAMIGDISERNILETRELTASLVASEIEFDNAEMGDITKRDKMEN
ncbi:hypothetical protein B0J14DRAFT_585680 [Halenospora varia]|nr:hypothetical protein B0J14DRAFT_585680 [Halenospora varia]